MTSTDDLVRKAQAARDALQGLYFSAEEGSPLEAGALAGAEAITGLLERAPLTSASGDLEKLSGAATPGRFMVEISPDGDALWVGSARGDGVKLRHIVYGVNGLLGYRAEYADRVRADADYIAALINAHRSGQKLGPMTADEILGVARKAAARAFIENGHEEIAKRVLAGQHDDYSNVKSSIDAINIFLAEQSPTPDGVIKGRGEDGRTWDEGITYGLKQLCAMLNVDPSKVRWDAATETVEGDVRSVIGNILRAWAGDDWQDLPAIREMLLDGQGDDDGSRILPDFQEDMTVHAMVAACVHLLERRRDALDGYAAGRRPDGHGLSHSVSSPSVSPAAAASIPGADDVLNARLKAAGMYSIPEMMRVTPLTRWTVQAGMTDLDQFQAWLDRRMREFLRMKAGYELGDNSKGDELYEWVLAHSAALSEVRENFLAARARDQRAEREDAQRPRPEAASPIGKAEAPASIVQPPSSQESGVGEAEEWRIFHEGDNPRPDVEWSGYLPDEAVSGPAIAYDDNTGAALFVVWWADLGNDRSQITHWRDLPAEILSAPRPSQREG